MPFVPMASAESFADVAASPAGLTDGPPGTGLSGCAASYAKALTNPWGAFDDLPCVPLAPPTQTQKWRTLMRFNVQTGTNSYGYFMCAPYISSNNTAKYAMTTNAYTGGASTVPATSGTGVVSAFNTQLPYTAANMAAGMSARLVALGIRSKNVTQLMNIGGSIVAGQIDDQGNAVGGYSPVVVTALSDFVYTEGRREGWAILNWRPFGATSLDWMPDDNLTQNANWTMMFVFTAPAASAVQTWEVEVVEFWEYQGVAPGTIAPPELTMTDADQTGTDRILSAAQRLPLTLDAHDWDAQMAHGVVEAMAHSDSVAKTVEDLTGLAGLPVKTAVDLVGSLMAFLAV